MSDTVQAGYDAASAGLPGSGALLELGDVDKRSAESEVQAQSAGHHDRPAVRPSDPRRSSGSHDRSGWRDIQVGYEVALQLVAASPPSEWDHGVQPGQRRPATSTVPAVTDVEVMYRYLRPSAAVVEQGRTDLWLSTSGGMTVDGPAVRPHFFEGFLGHAEQMAAALLVVAKVARTRFWMPPGMVAARVAAADPVVTSNGDRLRFESFSACGGVYARLDVLPGALDAVAATGTTNVDFNPPMRDALARVSGWDPMHLRVGEDLELITLDGAVVERRVPLPQRWLKGFAEVQVACASMQPALDLRVTDARTFLRGLPTASTAGGPALYATPINRGARVSSRTAPGAVPLAGPQRLRVLEPVLRFASGLRGYTHGDGPGAGTWELALRDARLVITLSPDLSRGFSGEGGVLRDLADDRSADDADLVSALLAFQPRIDVTALARDADLTPDRVRTALARLAAAGRVGYDCHDQAYFHRELPYDPAALEAMHPRLQAARALVDGGLVRLEAADPTIARVGSGSGDGEYVVRMVDGSPRCTCPWYGRHRDARGPCKHALAVDLARRQATS